VLSAAEFVDDAAAVLATGVDVEIGKLAIRIPQQILLLCLEDIDKQTGQ
jgi:hypothetical protein